jgi:GTP-binding protein
MVETCLRKRTTLRLVVLILDIRRDPSAEDLQMIHWLTFYHLPFLTILTKADKVTRSALAERRRRIGAALGLSAEATLLAFSAKTGAGKDALWREINRAVATVPTPSTGSVSDIEEGSR